MGLRQKEKKALGTVEVAQSLMTFRRGGHQLHDKMKASGFRAIKQLRKNCLSDTFTIVHAPQCHLSLVPAHM